MRQAGIVAAAGLYALDHNVERLADDHARARRLAEGWAAAGLPVDLELVETNFVQVDVGALGLGEREALELLARARRRLSRTMRPGVLRAVTHLDVGDDDVERALELVPQALERACPAPEHARSTACSQERQADRLPWSRPRSCSKGEQRLGERGRCAPTTTSDRAATPDTQYRIGSITKTFTATAVMQLRDDGQLDLDDRLEQHLDGVANGTPTIRRLLCHLSGLQREAGEMCVTGESPTEEQLIASMSEVEFVLGARRKRTTTRTSRSRCSARSSRGRAAGRTRDYVDERIIGPLGLTRTTWTPQAPKAQGYLVDEYARTVWTRARDRSRRHRGRRASSGRRSRISAAGRRSSRAAPTACSTRRRVEEMWFPQVMYYPRRLGARLGARADAATTTRARSTAATAARWPDTSPACTSTARRRSGAAALTNSGTRGDMDLFAIALAAKARELWPQPIEPWRPEQEPPADVRAILGRWWSEGSEFVFWWEGGTLKREGRRRRRPAAARRRSSGTATAGAPRRAASAASGCASTATS